MSTKRQNKETQDAIKRMMVEAYGENVDTGNNAEVKSLFQPPKLNMLPPAILERIFVHLANPADYKYTKSVITTSRQRNKIKYNRAKINMTKDFWKLPCVCKEFYDYFDKLTERELDQYPRPAVGLRIMPKPIKSAFKDDTVLCDQYYLVYIYGFMSIDNSVVCGIKEELSSLIYPAIIQSSICIQGFILDDELVEMLKLLDTSQVEEVYFNDIKGVDLEEYSIPDVVALFPNAMIVRFLGDDRYESLEKLSVEIEDMEKKDEKDIKMGTLICKYHNIDQSFRSKNKYRRNNNVLVREAKKLLTTPSLAKEHEAITQGSNEKLINFLNNPPAKPPKLDKAKLANEIKELEIQLTTLRNVANYVDNKDE